MSNNYNPFSEKQLKVLTWWCENSPYKEKDAIICDGAVRSGKTFCMSISFIAWSFSRFSNMSFAMCGKTIRSLKRNVIIPLMKSLTELGFSYQLKKSENILEVTYNGVMNRFYLFGGKDEMSASLIQGITLAGVFFDEVALMPRSFVEQSLARCSVEGSTFWFNCNPEYPGHWFYREWIKKREIKNALYLHFEMEDNPSLSKKMIARYESLYSGAFYERFVKGRWVAVTGAVYPFMDKDESFPDVPDVEFEEYAVSCDYGTVNPASFGLWGKYENVWYRIEEYYFNSRKEGYQKTDEEHYLSLKSLVGGRKLRCITVDPSAASFIQVIKRHGEFSVVPAKNNVIDGIRRVSTALKNGEIKICSTCRDSIREFSLYRWDEKNGMDNPIKENDHAMDDIRYFVTTILDGGSGFVAIATRR
ncbi:MAG: PBSX family phage terminase large subunit [Oscillospiraceae bacterium]|nr:PBSX family phage terminase large subunit [Oscillospiraceae bacterium]